MDSDNSSAIFVVTIIVTILNSAPSDAERLILYRLLADASSEMPEVLSMAYDSLIPRLSTTINTSSHPALIHNATIVLSRALADTAYTFPSSSSHANDSQTSLQQSFKGSISSLNGGGGGGAMIAVLDDLGMKGLSEGGFAPVKTER
jgi:neurofibromin 1